MKIIRNILMICFSLLIYHPLYGKCSNLQIGKMVKMGLSEEEITEVCGKPTIKSEDKHKPVVEESKIKPIKYSDKLGIRGNEGNLSTRFLNPPKVTDTRLYVGLGQVIYSKLYIKFEGGDESFFEQPDFYTGTNIFLGIDNRLFDDNLHYISFLYSSLNSNVSQRWREDDTVHSGNYYIQGFTEQNIILETMTLEYVHHLFDDFLVGLSYNSVSLKRDIKMDYHWYNSEDDSKTELITGGTFNYEPNHDYNYNSLRLQKIINNLRFDFYFTPEVISKENYSGDFNGTSVTGESTTGFGRFLGLNVTKLDYNNDISFGYYKENENTDTSDPENIFYSFGYILEPISGLVFKGIIDYNKSEGITSSVNPYTSITIDGTVLIKVETGTFSINYEHINHKYEDLGDSSDKYRIDDTFINIINLGFITNL